jgi:hypothetical protein
MSWGYKILVLYVLFVGLMLTMVFGSYQHSFNLVSKDYYEQELKYQDVIDGSKNYSLTQEKLELNVNENSISILWPNDTDLNLVKKVQIWLYNNAESKGDIRFGMETLSIPEVEIPLGKQQHGNYTLKIQWIMDETPYYFEKSFRL